MTGPVTQLDERMVALETAASRATLSSAFCEAPPCALVLHPDRLEVRVDLWQRDPATGHLPRRTVQGVGALVLCARVALAAQGWAVEVDRLPRPEDRELLAVLRPVEGAPEPGLAPLAALAAAGPLRRRSPRVRPLPPTLLERLERTAALEDSVLVPVLSEAGRRLIGQLDDEAAAVLGRQPGGGADAAHPGAFLLLATERDDELARFRSGEAMERVLLALAREGRAASVLTRPLDVPLVRARVRSALCWDDHPQALLRVT